MSRMHRQPVGASRPVFRAAYSLLLTPYFRRRRGSTLLVTLLVTTALLAVAVNLATVVTLGLQRSSLSAATLPLLYQAESGAERALFRVRQLKILPAELNLGANCDCGGGLCPPIAGCSVSAAFPTAPDLAFYPLRKDQSVRVDLLDATPNVPECSFDAGTEVSRAACVDELKISCQDADGLSPLGTLALTYTKVADISSGWGGGLEDSTRQRVVSFGSLPAYECPLSGQTFSFTGDPPGNLLGSASYVVNIRAVTSDVNIKYVRAYSGGKQRGLTGRVRIISTVTTPFQQQQVQVETASRAATSGLLDYVLFSECGIDKTVPTPGHVCP